MEAPPQLSIGNVLLDVFDTNSMTKRQKQITDEEEILEIIANSQARVSKMSQESATLKGSLLSGRVDIQKAKVLIE